MPGFFHDSNNCWETPLSLTVKSRGANEAKRVKSYTLCYFKFYDKNVMRCKDVCQGLQNHSLESCQTSKIEAFSKVVND